MNLQVMQAKAHLQLLFNNFTSGTFVNSITDTEYLNRFEFLPYDRAILMDLKSNKKTLYIPTPDYIEANEQDKFGFTELSNLGILIDIDYKSNRRNILRVLPSNKPVFNTSDLIKISSTLIKSIINEIISVTNGDMDENKDYLMNLKNRLDSLEPEDIADSCKYNLLQDVDNLISFKNDLNDGTFLYRIIVYTLVCILRYIYFRDVFEDTGDVNFTKLTKYLNVISNIERNKNTLSDENIDIINNNINTLLAFLNGLHYVSEFVPYLKYNLEVSILTIGSDLLDEKFKSIISNIDKLVNSIRYNFSYMKDSDFNLEHWEKCKHMVQEILPTLPPFETIMSTLSDLSLLELIELNYKMIIFIDNLVDQPIKQYIIEIIHRIIVSNNTYLGDYFKIASKYENRTYKEFNKLISENRLTNDISLNSVEEDYPIFNILNESFNYFLKSIFKLKTIIYSKNERNIIKYLNKYLFIDRVVLDFADITLDFDLYKCRSICNYIKVNTTKVNPLNYLNLKVLYPLITELSEDDLEFIKFLYSTNLVNLFVETIQHLENFIIIFSNHNLTKEFVNNQIIDKELLIKYYEQFVNIFKDKRKPEQYTMNLSKEETNKLGDIKTSKELTEAFLSTKGTFQKEHSYKFTNVNSYIENKTKLIEDINQFGNLSIREITLQYTLQAEILPFKYPLVDKIFKGYFPPNADNIILVEPFNLPEANKFLTLKQLPTRLKMSFNKSLIETKVNFTEQEFLDVLQNVGKYDRFIVSSSRSQQVDTPILEHLEIG